MGAEHILYAVDYPYVKPAHIYNLLANSNLTEEQKELIAHGNAERLLKL
ncbi:amidohydrolase family protein [Listeria monocytogenes]|nr:amidohydrolase family protein [Listeria monocytogenes]